MTTFFAIFIMLHGLAHLWYVVLSMQWVPFNPEMGWSGESWVLTSSTRQGVSRKIAAILYTSGALGFVISGSGLLIELPWFRPLMLGSACFSLITVVLFWDGKGSQIIEKGFFGFVIDILVIIVIGIMNWPAGIP